jgi:arylsulfatase A-like enzyme
MKQKNEKGQNFFLYLQYSNIHTGIMNEVLKIYDNFSTEYFENKLKNEKRYDQLFLNAEKYLSKIMQIIYELELERNSIIIIMSDHGISVGEKIGERAYGTFCYDYTIKTFAYFLIPNIIPREISQQIRTIDYIPTVLDYLQIPLDSNYEKMDGESLLPLFNGGKILEKYAYSETGNPQNQKAPPKEPNTHSIRTSTWKLIYNSYNETKELYNLKEDPEELRNLSGTCLEIEEELWKELIKIKNNN